MIEIEDKAECCGCGACSQSCSSKCIHMTEDEEGFLYPVVNKELCIECGICEKICPVLNHVSKDNYFKEPIAYAAVNKDEKIRKESSSGGVFTLFSEYILSKNGIVFGAAMSEDCESVNHIGVEKAEALRLLRGSKYVQSEIGNTYQCAKGELEKGRLVLFSGTPCQIAGLKGYLKKDYENLFTIEVICHGVPSPALWKKYIIYVGKKLRAPISRVIFRDKIFSDGERLMMHIKARNNKVYKAYEEEDPFYCFFLGNFCLRPSCYQCRFKAGSSAADITIGDFWGGNEVVPGFGEGGNLSLIYLHSDKGKGVFNFIKEHMKLQWTEYETSVVYNSAYKESVSYPKERGGFFYDLENLAFSEMIKKYRKLSVKMRLRCVLEKLHLLNIIKHARRVISA